MITKEQLDSWQAEVSYFKNRSLKAEEELAELKKDIVEFEKILGSDLNGYQIVIDDLEIVKAELAALGKDARELVGLVEKRVIRDAAGNICNRGDRERILIDRILESTKEEP